LFFLQERGAIFFSSNQIIHPLLSRWFYQERKKDFFSFFCFSR
jgi:hypothetical protein